MTSEIVTDFSALIKRYKGNLPRYTSYPTAASFTAAVGFFQAQTWLSTLSTVLPAEEPISLYCHVPFCDELCRFCGCHTSVVRHEEQRITYAETLKEELRRIALLVGQRPVQHIHFGGGTPTTLPLNALRSLMHTIGTLFALTPHGEIAMEIDPRHVPTDYPQALKALGFNRVSLGVQDINPRVQEACGRLQSFEHTKDVIERVRSVGIRGVNIDLIYGLPYQTQESVTQTAHQIASLKPERLAVFGYAHVPWKQKRQQLMPTEALPDSTERLAQRRCIEQVLHQAGYEKIGLDHYALPTDSLAHAARNGTLHRNFQGYTIDPCQVLIGIGASAISMLPQGFVQNIVSPAQYMRALEETPHLPIARGVVRTAQDHQRWAIIERLMCDLSVDVQNPSQPAKTAEKSESKTWSNTWPDSFEKERAALEAFIQDGILTRHGSVIRLTEKGRPFLRHVAAVFDVYRESLAQQAQKEHNKRTNTSLEQEEARCFSSSL